MSRLNFELEKEIEEVCIASNGAISYTFFRHPPVFDELADASQDIHDSKTLVLPKGAEYYISREDIVEAIVAAAFKPKRHANKSYDLLGPDRLRGKKVASILGEVLHETLAYEAVSRSDTEKLQAYLVKFHHFSAEDAVHVAEYLKAAKVKTGKDDVSRQEQSTAESHRDKALAVLFSSGKELQSLRTWSDAHAHLFM